MIPLALVEREKYCHPQQVCTLGIAGYWHVNDLNLKVIELGMAFIYRLVKCVDFDAQTHTILSSCTAKKDIHSHFLFTTCILGQALLVNFTSFRSL